MAESAIAIGAKGLWLQLGVYHLRALALAQSAGLTCVADKCTKVEHRILSLQGWSR
ncbi:MAG: CoA-binding protein [Pseudomonadota bacterium]|nr:CoA-binding protein [Pseudomonadota bacterium]